MAIFSLQIEPPSSPQIYSFDKILYKLLISFFTCFHSSSVLHVHVKARSKSCVRYERKLNFFSIQCPWHPPWSRHFVTSTTLFCALSPFLPDLYSSREPSLAMYTLSRIARTHTFATISLFSSSDILSLYSFAGLLS